MTIEDAVGNIEVGGFREWLPLPLDVQAVSYPEELVEHFADDPAGADTVRAMAIELVGLGRQLADTSDDDSLMISAWSLLPPGGDRLELRGMVTMTCQRVAEGITPGELIEQMCAEVALRQPPDVEELATRSGPAHMVRLRHFESDGASVDIHEMAVCFWLPPSLPGVAVLMSSMLMPDLIAAADLASALRPLAESVRGL